MADKKVIEFVCTANNGRSPVAELIARDYFNSIGLSSEFEVCSSGTLVDKIDSGDLPLAALLPVIEAGKRRDFYDFSDQLAIDVAVKISDRNAIKRYFAKASTMFADEEDRHREYALREFRIRGNLKEGRTQTVARRDTLAVLPMDRGNYDRVLEIYKGSGCAPIMSVMSVLATEDLRAEVANSFGLGEETYKRGIRQMVKEVPEALRRIIAVL